MGNVVGGDVLALRGRRSSVDAYWSAAAPSRRQTGVTKEGGRANRDDDADRYRQTDGQIG